jgi:hypothetical protein
MTQTCRGADGSRRERRPGLTHATQETPSGGPGDHRVAGRTTQSASPSGHGVTLALWGVSGCISNDRWRVRYPVTENVRARRRSSRPGSAGPGARARCRDVRLHAPDNARRQATDWASSKCRTATLAIAITESSRRAKRTPDLSFGHIVDAGGPSFGAHVRCVGGLLGHPPCSRRSAEVRPACSPSVRLSWSRVEVIDTRLVQLYSCTRVLAWHTHVRSSIGRMD